MEDMQKALLVFFALIVIIALGFYFNAFKDYFADFKMEALVLDSKPTLSGIITSNPDFDYPERAWLTEQDNPEAAVYIPKDWSSDGWFETIPIDGRDNVIVIHPISVNTPRFIERMVYIPSGPRFLSVGLANIRGKMEYSTTPDIENYGDVIFIIKIKDIEKDKWYNDAVLVDSTEGWKDIKYDLDERFSEKDVIIRVEGRAGGPHSDWDGEWAAVDYIAIV